MISPKESMNNAVQHTETGLTVTGLLLLVREWYRYFLSKWLIVLIVTAVGGGVGIIYALFQKSMYNAELTFALEDSSSSGGLSGAMGIASQFGVDLGGGGNNGVFSGDNLLALLKSRAIIEKALLHPITGQDGKQTSLAANYMALKDLQDESKPVVFPTNTDRRYFTRQQDSVLGVIYRNVIAKNVSVERKDKKLGVISLNVKSESEFFSKTFSELLVKEVSDFYVTTKTKKAVENVAILQRQTDSVRRHLNSAISGVALSLDANPNANMARQVLLAPSQRRTVDVEANRAILMELVKNLEMSKISLRKETPLIQVIDSPVFPLPKEEFGKKMGLLIGGVIGGLLAVVVLAIKKFLTDLNL